MTTGTTSGAGALASLRWFDPDDVLTPAEVGAALHVSGKTVTRWAKAGKLPHFRTMGGHRRFRAGDVLKALEDAQQ